MQAVVIDAYGPPEVLEQRDLEKPSPGDFEVMVEVHASSINPVDWKLRRGDLKLLIPRKFPRVPGIDFSGVVIAAGNGVKRVKAGDAVFGMTNPFTTTYGSYAEYAIAAHDSLAIKPEAISFTDAAALPVAGLTAYKAINKQIKLKAGNRIFINGASGGVGSLAVQMAKRAGGYVVASCSESNIDFVRSLGADEVHDYAKWVPNPAEEKFDSIFDVAAKLSFAKVKHVLTGNGTYVTTVPALSLMPKLLSSAVLPGQKARFVLAGSGSLVDAELVEVANLVSSGHVKPVIQKVISLAEIQEAHKEAEHEHARGKTVIKIV